MIVIQLRACRVDLHLTDKENRKLWIYFLSVEAMLVETQRFCEIGGDNFFSYSDEYTKIVLLSGVHFETCAKQLLKSLDPNAPVRNMGEIRTALMHQRPGICDASVPVGRDLIEIWPLQFWKEGKAPLWWEAYTGLKHNYIREHKHGSQINAIYALSAVFLVLLYIFENSRSSLHPRPILLQHDWPDTVVWGEPGPLP